MKKYIEKNVYVSSIERINWIFDNFEKYYLSFSGGKDSTVLFHLCMEIAKKRNIKVGILYIDLEAQYKYTIDHVNSMIELYKENIELYWICLPISLRNSVSQYEPKWCCWEKDKDWIRDLPKNSISDIKYFNFFESGMEFEDFVIEFGKWYSEDKWTACMVGIRSDESLNRYRAIKGKKTMWRDKIYTTHIKDKLFNAYPIYDWKCEDIWIYHSKTKKIYNKLYDLMNKAGLSIYQQRICQPYGDDQRKGLWLYHVIEPETWGKLISRVNGANFGSIYVCETGNVFGNIKIKKPDNHTWESFAKLLLNTLPEKSKEHFENKIEIFLNWWSNRGYRNGIPDEANINDEANKKVPSWRRICKCLLKNDYWCKTLSFSMTKKNNYDRYLKLMRRRKEQWNYLKLKKQYRIG